MTPSPTEPNLSPFRDAFLDAPIGIIVIDLQHRFLEANPSMLKLLGYTREELLAMGPLYALTHPDDRHASEDLVAKIHAQSIPGFTVEKRYVRKDGRSVWAQVHNSLLRDSATHEPNGILGLVVDITDRKRAEQNAAIEASRARSVIEATSDGVYTLNRDWKITYVNRSAIHTVGFDPSDVGKNFWQIYPAAANTKIGPAFRRAMYDRIPVEFEDFYPEPINLHYTAAVYPTDEGITVFYRDITQRRKSELALRESEKMAVVGRLAASIAHEINNPLEAVTNLLFLAREHGLPPEVANYLRMAESELKRVSHITTLTLSFHRQPAAPTAVTARALFDSVLDLYRSRLVNRNIAAIVGHVTPTPFCALEGELRQVLANLVSNAIDATSPGGKLYLRAHAVCDPITGAPVVRLIVADTGQGVPPHLRKKIFEAFFTTKELGGTGLGLWLSKSIIDNHRGRLTLRSSPGRGTVFALTLPVTATPGLHSSSAAAA